MAEKIKREDAHDSRKGWKGWETAMVPANEGRACKARDNGNVGYYCDNIRDDFDDVDCDKHVKKLTLSHVLDCNNGIYEWKAVHHQARDYVVYIGSTHRKTRKDLESRIMEYCRNGSHKKRLINKVLRNGYELHVRVKEIPGNRKMSEDEENKLLKRYNYVWNQRRNKPYRGDEVPPCPP